MLPDIQFNSVYAIMGHHVEHLRIQVSVKGSASINQNHEEYLDAERTCSQEYAETFA